MFQNRKKIIVGLIIGLLTVVAGSVIVSYLSSQDVTITSNDPNATITVQEANGTPKELGKGTVNRRLAFGDYAVRATTGNKETRALLSLKGGERANVSLELSDVRQPRKLSSSSVRKITATNTSLHYLNSAFEQLESLDLATGTNKPIIPNLSNIADVYWITPTTAYILDNDDNYSYFDGTSATPIGVDEAYTISVGPDGTLATHAKDTITLRTTNGEAAYTIKTDAHQPRMALGAQKRMLVYDTVIDSEGDVAAAQPVIYEGKNKLSHLNDGLKNLVIAGASWSPDASSVALSTQQGIHILDISSGRLTRLSIHGTPHANSFTWINNQSGLYFADQNIWHVTPSTQIWKKVATTKESVPTNAPFAVSPDGTTVYFITDLPSGGEILGGLYTFTLRQ